MGYFNELPNIQVVNRIKTEVSIDETVIIKNLFKRAKIRDDIIDVVTAFEYYQVTENETPSQLAEKIYGEPELDWVILTTNNIINVQDEWPIDNNSFNKYLLDKYGSEEKLLEIHHYETIELKDSYGRVIIPQGLLVDKTFYDAPEFRNYTTAPFGIIFPPITIPGTIASAISIVDYQTKSVVGITSLQPGLGYKFAPNITFSDPPQTTNASVNASVSGFAVNSFNTLTGGQGYLTAPTVTIGSPPDSIQAIATCAIGSTNGEVLSVNLINGGSGYGITVPIITFQSPPIVIEGSYYNQSSISVGNQIDGMFIRENGLDLYTTNAVGSGLIKQYSMSIGWDVTTVSFVRELNVSADFSYCTGIEFKLDGTRMFISGGAGGSYKLISYNLSTPWNISTATKLHEKSISSPAGVRFNLNGSKLFLLESSASGVITQYSLSTAWNITSIVNPVSIWTTLQASNSGSYRGYTSGSWSSFMNTYAYSRVPQSGNLSDVPEPYEIKTDTYTVNFPYDGRYRIEAAVDNFGEVILNGVSYTPESFTSNTVAVGTTTLVAGNKTLILKQQNTVYGSSTFAQNPVGLAVSITYLGGSTLDLAASTGETINLGFSFSSNGSKLFTTGESTSKIFEFTLTTPFSFTGGVKLINDFYVGSQLGNPSDVFLKSDNTKFVVSGGSSDKLFEYLTVSLARATATLTNGSVTNINLDSPGIGYTVAPTITIDAPFPAVQSTATAIMVADTVVTKTWSVINSTSQSYLFTGSSSGSNIGITATAGDTLIFNVNASGHPFWIKTAQTVGTGNSVTTGTITNNGVTGNVGVVIPITWNTTGVAAGTYYYVCQNHITMSGTITISAPTTGTKINSITLTNGGFGYLFNPSVSITLAPTYRTAVGFAILNSTTGISTIALTDGGANYITPPTITIGAPQEIQKVFVGDVHFQNNQYWRWNGTAWQEKFTEEFKYFDGATSTVKAIQGNLISKPITNYEYEINLNEKKRSILILKPQYLSLVITDLKNMMKYNPESSTYISDNLKSTYNPKYTES